VFNKAWSKNRIVTALAAAALGLSIGWTLAAQDKPAKQWKDQQEYQLANDAGKENDAGKRLASLDKWKQGYATSDYSDVRDYLYVTTYLQLKDFRKAFDLATDILKAHPDDFPALQAIEVCIFTMTPLQPADLDVGEKTSRHILDNADKIFAGDNHPPNLTAEQFQQAKDPMKAYAQRAIGYIYMQKKDAPKAEVELLKGLKMDPTQSQFAYFLGSQLLAQQQKDPAKAPLALFYFARAAAYDGPNAIPAAQRKPALDFLTRAYVSYHGSNQGLDQLLAQAKTTPFPPDGFSIVSTADINQKKAQEEEAARQANPALTIWSDTKKLLQADNGPSYFDAMVKDTAFPRMKGKIVSMTPATRPKELVVGVEKGDVADATLKFEAALAGKMEAGEEIEFEGVPQTFSANPYMIVFDVDKEKLYGWTGKNTAAPKGKAAPKGPAPAKKQ
jgi:hypothetical protein